MAATTAIGLTPDAPTLAPARKGKTHVDDTGLLLIQAALAGTWTVFEKAGRAAWEALVPICHIDVLTLITGQPWWLMILALIPLVNMIGDVAA